MKVDLRQGKKNEYDKKDEESIGDGSSDCIYMFSYCQLLLGRWPTLQEMCFRIYRLTQARMDRSAMFQDHCGSMWIGKDDAWPMQLVSPALSELEDKSN